MIRALIVDDSATMRQLIASVLRQDPEIEVVGQAADPLQARQAIKALNPDVLTLDIEMPNMGGLEFLEKLMRLRPMPVVMVSTLTRHGAEATLRALELGAVDYMAKPASGHLAGFAGLAAMVKAASRARVRPPAQPSTPCFSSGTRLNGHLVAIGSSTGGVEALLAILSQFPPRCPPTVVTQHMPAAFTRSFAQRLDRLCAPQVAEAVEGAVLAPGQVYIAPGGPAHLQVIRAGGALRCRLREAAPVNGHRPSVDVLFESVARAAGRAAVGVILTGMGRDGAAGLLAMSRAGACTLGQDEASCVVYGMPKAAFEAGAVEQQHPLEGLAAAILRHTHEART